MAAACQPQLHSDLPTGSAAYEVLEPRDAPASTAYLLRSSDVVTVHVFQEPDLTVEDMAIDLAGNIVMPLIGQVHAEGQTQAELAQEIEQAYASKFLRNPQVAVVIKEANSNTVSVDGEVRKPGVYPIQADATLVTAIALAEGMDISAKYDEVLVFRTINGQRMGARFDLTDVRAGRAPDPRILPGDKVVVGFSRARALYRDVLIAAPLFNVFTRF